MTDNENINKILSNLKKNSEIKECFYHKPNECSKGAIKNAHSISKSGRLDLIKGLVNKNEKVYSLSEIIVENGIAKRGIKDIGWGHMASTFYGFCNHHDTSLFLPIENDNAFNKSLEHCFLHSYRSFSFTYHQVKKAHKLVGNSIEDISNLLNELPIADLSAKLSGVKNQINELDAENTPFSKEKLQKQADEILISKIKNLKIRLDPSLEKSNIELFKSNIDKLNSYKDISELMDKIPGLFDQFKTTLPEWKEKLSYTKKQLDNEELHSWLVWMNEYKRKLDNAIENKLFDSLKYCYKIKDELFPFACAFAFSPNFFYDSVIFPKDYPNEVINSCLIVTVLPDKSNKTIILFSCFDGDRQSEYFLKKLFSLINEEEFEKAVTSIIINSASNVFLSPVMWDKLGDRQQLLEREINSSRTFDEFAEKPFMSELNFFNKEFSAKKLGIVIPT